MRSVGHPGLSDSKKLEFIEAFSTDPCAEQRKWEEGNRLYVEGSYDHDEETIVRPLTRWCWDLVQKVIAKQEGFRIPVFWKLWSDYNCICGAIA